MTLTKLLQQLRALLPQRLLNHDAYPSLLLTPVLIFASLAVWFGGSYLTLNDYTPLAAEEKRMYVILFLVLAWLLKLLLIDLGGNTSPLPVQDPVLRKKMQALLKRFQGAVSFLKKTTITRQNKAIYLNQLPWYLLLGPCNAGKTALLAHSDVNFILQRKTENPADAKGEMEKCDWWVTKEASIVDVPGHYLSFSSNHPKSHFYLQLWQFFLRLIKKQRGKNGVNGVIIALPLPEIMREDDPQKFKALQKNLFRCLQELGRYFNKPIPCQIIITKCDLLPGFTEFFAESSNDEMMQAWGVALPPIAPTEKLDDMYVQRFNSLIKKLNRQLLWRLHHERNPMARPLIKNFPYQVERLKECLLDFIKKFSLANPPVRLQGIYLTSALQISKENEPYIIDESNTTQQAVQIFKEPKATSRAYFIKQFMSHSFSNQSIDETHSRSAIWQRRLQYALALCVITLTSVFLIKDFKQGLKHSSFVQTNLSNYQIVTQQIHDPDEHLLKTILLLNTLQQAANYAAFTFDLQHLLTFYSNQSRLKAKRAYRQALESILIPEIKNYFEDYLKLPVNRHPENVYEVLKSYLMLGDAAHFDADYIINTLKKILPKSFSEKHSEECKYHLTIALHALREPLLLNADLIKQSRDFFGSLPEEAMAYIILKNLHNNNRDVSVDLGTGLGTPPTFVSRQITVVPTMFTVNAYPDVIGQEITLASEEAIVGNWVLGNRYTINKNPQTVIALIEQLRITYINNYIDTWERLIANIHLFPPQNLQQTDLMIKHLISNQSPLLQLLQTLHTNTFFEPIASSSPHLQRLSLLIDKNDPEHLLYAIFTGLQKLHAYLELVINANDPRKAAFEIMAKRMKNISPDAITELRLIADKSPEPLRTWLRKITDDAWAFLMQEASRYIDFTWQNHIYRFYQTDIANRYPFSNGTEQEVELKKFVEFFGKSGLVMRFYQHYLQPFVDTSTVDWRWKVTDHGKLPFSNEALRQIQQAVRVHQAFFANGDDQLFVQFALQKYRFGKQIQTVKLKINDTEIIDDNNASTPHLVTWPKQGLPKRTTLELTLTNDQTIKRHFAGEWGWFQLVSQSFENMITKKEILMNFSKNEEPVKYILMTQGKVNPFIALNLSHFQLPQQLSDAN